MRHAYRPLALAAATMLCLAALLQTGCAPQPTAEDPSPGLTSQSNDSATLAGWVAPSGVEGWNWAIFASEPGTADSAPPMMIATLRAGSVDEATIATFEGKYVNAVGRALTGSGPNGGAELLVDQIQEADAP